MALALAPMVSMLAVLARSPDATLERIFGISRSQHYDRNRLQGPAPTLQAALSDPSKWNVFYDEGHNFYHMRGVDDENNIKVISKQRNGNGVFEEYIYNAITGDLETDPLSYGTVNFAADGSEHFFKDMLPYFAWGNGNGDTSTAGIRNAWFAESALVRLSQELYLFAEKAEELAFKLYGEPELVIDVADYIVESVQNRFVAAMTEASPLILDLGGDGVQLINLDSASSVFWDVDQDGILEESAWVGRDDGLLAVDLNGDGLIASHAELFGTLDEDGFSVLRTFDSDGDAKITNADSQFDLLRVWRDANGNAVSERDELLSLRSLDIVSIDLAAIGSNAVIAGNRISSTSTYTLENGDTRTIVDAWFRYDERVTEHAIDVSNVTPDMVLLPSLRGYGNIPSLLAGMSTDPSLFASSREIGNATLPRLFDPSFDLESRFRTLLFDWANVSELAPTARGRYIDARELAFLEALTATSFTQRGGPNPYVEASATLHAAFLDAQNAMLARFLGQTAAAGLVLNLGTYDFLRDKFTGAPSINVAALTTMTATWTYSGNDLVRAWTGVFRFFEGTIGLDELTTSDRNALASLIDRTDASDTIDYQTVYKAIFPQEGLGLNGTNGADNLVGGEGDDTLDTGNGNDILNGRGGNDELRGGPGDDILNGETGDDTLVGSSGNDTYVYTSGLDTIRESSGNDTIQFGAGVTLARLEIGISPTNENDAIISIDGAAALIVEDMFTTGGLIETLRFADQSTFSTAALTAPKNGTNGNDVLTGNDAALFPHDYLNGGNGNDRLIGGLGDDRLTGGSGNDTYVVTSGHDRIADSTGAIDRIEFGANYAFDAAVLTRVDRDLVISFGGAPAATIIGQFDTSGTIESIAFHNGQVIDLTTRRYTTEGTEARDTLRGIDSGGGGDILRGRGGNDTLIGYDGDDELDGGAGDDRLNGGDGNDIYIRSTGIDTVNDTGGVDSIALGNVAAGRIGLARDGSTLKVSIDGVETVRVTNQFSLTGRIETLTIADGATIDLLTRSYPLIGGADADRLYGISHGGNPDDVIRGLGGADRLYGEDGNDLLDGGDGDDHLFGGKGDDRYEPGAGINLVSDTGGADDTLLLPVVATPEGVTLVRSGAGDLLVAWTGGAALIEDAYDAAKAIETLVFANGVRWSLPDQFAPIIGSDGRDILNGNREALGSRDDVIFGLLGNDTLNGLDGNDTLDGGGGTDTLSGGAGIDILRGGEQSDRFVGSRSELAGDTIADFSAKDRINITDANPNTFSFQRVGEVLTFGAGQSLKLIGYNGVLVAKAATGGGVELQARPTIRDDFNGDGRSDILWRNVNGAFTDWLSTASGGFAGNAAANGTVPTDWKIVGKGDYNGDGRDDILWRNDNGAMTNWLANGSGGFGGNAAANATVGTDWKIAGTGDFNGDGRDDILWRNANGAMTNWLANASGGFSGNAAANATVGTDWKIAGTGDFNGDGFGDILWRNDNGALTSWLGNAAGGFAGNAASNAQVGTDWKVAGTGDFNGDGFSDILWRNDNGALTSWLGNASGGFAGNAAANGSVGTDWKIAGTGDYNGDGFDDILWRNDNGALTDWLGNSAGGFAGNAAANAFVGTDWMVI